MKLRGLCLERSKHRKCGVSVEVEYLFSVSCQQLSLAVFVGFVFPFLVSSNEKTQQQKNKKNEKLSGLLGAFLSGDVSRLMYDA